MKTLSQLLFFIIALLTSCSDDAPRIKTERKILHASLNFNDSMTLISAGYPSTDEAIYGAIPWLNLTFTPERDRVLNVVINQWTLTTIKFNYPSNEIAAGFTLDQASQPNLSEITLSKTPLTRVLVPDPELAKKLGERLASRGSLRGFFQIFPPENQEFDIQLSIDMDVTVEYKAF